MNTISSYHPASSQSAETQNLKNQSTNTAGKAAEAQAKDTLLGRLAEHIPGVSAEDMKNQKAEDFTPDKVAQNISNFVGMGLESMRREGRSEEDIQKMHQAAMRGIEKGFNEAKEILEGLGAFAIPTIEPMIDETFDKTMDAVQALLPNQDYSPSFGRARGTEAFYAERYSQSESFSLKLTTKEGDEVTIQFGSSSYESSSFGAVSNANGQAMSASMERGSSSSMFFSIEGDLNDEEMAAINDLLKDVNEIADEFFSGDLQEAFDMATEFEMDGEQLASMNLRLVQTQSYSAASAYSTVGALPSVENADALSPIKDFGDRLTGAAEDPMLGFMEEADKFISDLINSLTENDIRYLDADEQETSRLDQNMKLMNEMMDSLFDN